MAALVAGTTAPGADAAAPAHPRAHAQAKAKAKAPGADKDKNKGKDGGKSKRRGPDKDEDRAKSKTGGGSRIAASGKTKTKKKKEEVPVARGKVAVFLFQGDDAPAVRRQVVSLLRARGLKVTTTLRSVDSAEQYRDMAATLGLAAYIDGEVSADGNQGSATVHVRSGASGLRIASATFSGERRKLRTEVSKELWSRLGAALARTCADAARPRKPENAPMRIDAGKPIENTPAEADEGNSAGEGEGGERSSAGNGPGVPVV